MSFVYTIISSLVKASMHKIYWNAQQGSGTFLSLVEGREKIEMEANRLSLLPPTQFRDPLIMQMVFC